MVSTHDVTQHLSELYNHQFCVTSLIGVLIGSIASKWWLTETCLPCLRIVNKRGLFRQVCKMSPIPMCLSVSVFDPVCACITIVCTCNSLEQIKNVKMPPVDFDICHRMALMQKLYSVTLTYLLKVTIINFYISETARASAKKNVNYICRF